MRLEKLAIPVTLFDGSQIDLEIFAEGKSLLFEIDAHDARENGESPFQIHEGGFYEYRLPPPYCLEQSAVITQLNSNTSAGRICPNTYVGNLLVNVLAGNNQTKCGELEIEIRSAKSGYRDDYRNMLANIAEKCTALVMRYNSPATQHFTMDFGGSASILYQRFAFIKSILERSEFQESVQRIISLPVTAWQTSKVQKSTAGLKRIRTQLVHQLMVAPNRTPVPAGSELARIFKTIPRQVTVDQKSETLDCAENRFIRYALQAFLAVCSEFRSKTKEETKIHREALLLEQKLEGYLSHDLFKEVSAMNALPQNSPVLQRKGGYRELFRTWLMFDLAARLVWHGGDDVYQGGKKDTATLYEYWIYFELLNAVREVFDIEPHALEALIKPTGDGLELKLQRGKHLAIAGIFNGDTRKLHVEFSYNRTFSGGNAYPRAGSWSGELRPDYTLTIWPYGITQDQAEIQELIVHLQFDAKYSIDALTSLFNADENLGDEKQEQRADTYKRGALLKMHTYRDAIRRTAGAYILYPGSGSVVRSGFHELLPGLGAFAISPSKYGSGTAELIVFLKDVLAHILNRASQRESMSLKMYEIYREKDTGSLNQLMPETIGDNRSLLPAYTHVLVAYYKSEEHYQWILNTGCYNARAKSDEKELSLGAGEVDAKYLLLHTRGETTTGRLFRILKSPIIKSRKDLKAMKYPSPGQDFYLVYTIDPAGVAEFKDRMWQINKLKQYARGRRSALPFSVSLKDLMKVILPATTPPRKSPNRSK